MSGLSVNRTRTRPTAARCRLKAALLDADLDLSAFDQHRDCVAIGDPDDAAGEEFGVA
jgi:hypothetical protein